MLSIIIGGMCIFASTTITTVYSFNVLVDYFGTDYVYVCKILFLVTKPDFFLTENCSRLHAGIYRTNCRIHLGKF